MSEPSTYFVRRVGLSWPNCPHVRTRNVSAIGVCPLNQGPSRDLTESGREAFFSKLGLDAATGAHNREQEEMDKHVKVSELDRALQKRRGETPRVPGTPTGKMGRPRSTDPLSRPIHVRITEEEYAALTRFGEDHGQKPGTTVRRLVRAYFVHGARLVHQGRVVDL